MAAESISGLVHRALLDLDRDTDPRAPGGAVTVALCGHWEHEGSCRWPHHTAISEVGTDREVRVVFIAGASEELEVRHRIRDALASASGWRLVETGPAPPHADELELAERLSRAVEPE